MRQIQIPILLIVLALVAFPWSVGAVSSTSYQVIPEQGFTATHGVEASSASYQVQGSIEPFTGNMTSTSYTQKSGGGFEFYCGDGFVDPAGAGGTPAAETCDGSNLNGATCTSQGFASGTLSCSSSCALDTSACNAGGGGGGGGGGTVSTVPSAPTVDTSISSDFVYSASLLLSGVKSSDATSVKVNTSSTGVTYPTNTSWKVTVTLAYGLNTFSLKASNTSGDSSETIFDVYRRLIGDITQDNKVNDYDLSRLVKLWGGKDRGGDFNEDSIVNDYDFSMMVARWGTSV